jgi:uncharacterized membrane protein
MKTVYPIYNHQTKRTPVAFFLFGYIFDLDYFAAAFLATTVFFAVAAFLATAAFLLEQLS